MLGVLKMVEQLLVAEIGFFAVELKSYSDSG
jgi:hypothetical protein